MNTRAFWMSSDQQYPASSIRTFFPSVRGTPPRASRPARFSSFRILRHQFGKALAEQPDQQFTVEKSAEIYVKVRSMGGHKVQTITKENFLQLAKEFGLDLNEGMLD